MKYIQVQFMLKKLSKKETRMMFVEGDFLITETIKKLSYIKKIHTFSKFISCIALHM